MFHHGIASLKGLSFQNVQLWFTQVNCTIHKTYFPLFSINSNVSFRSRNATLQVVLKFKSYLHCWNYTVLLLLSLFDIIRTDRELCLYPLHFTQYTYCQISRIAKVSINKIFKKLEMGLTNISSRLWYVLLFNLSFNALHQNIFL